MFQVRAGNRSQFSLVTEADGGYNSCAEMNDPWNSTIENNKPLAGHCHHQWHEQESPYVTSQVCAVCKLYRYKASTTADWEYRAPIPVGQRTAD